MDFETPERAARQQLVAHLLRNAEQPIYLRGPAGAGKTHFCQRLADDLGGEFAVVRLIGTPDLDVPAAVQARLRAAGGGERSTDERLLLVVDDADALSALAVDMLYQSHREGAQLLLCGRGERLPPTGPVGLHLIDLPPFSQQQALAFLAARDPGLGERLGPVGLARFCREAGGWPGRLLDPGAQVETPRRRGAAQDAGRLMFWGGGVLLIGLTLVVLWQQDAVNAWLTGTPGQSDAAVPPRKGAQTLVLPPLVPQASLPLAMGPDLPTERPILVDVPTPTAAPEELGTVVATTAEVVEPAMPLDLQEPAAEPALMGEGESLAGALPDLPAAASAEPAPPAAEVVPAPALASEPVPEPAAVEATAPVAAVTPAPPAAPASVAAPPALPGAAWLQAQPVAHYTLQLLGARDLVAIRRFVKSHSLQGDYAVAVRDRGGAPWYSLLYGSFADRDAALRQKAALPGLPVKDAWPRRFSDVR